MKWQFNSFAQTDLGLVREGNEDSAIYGANLIAVADGMGGHQLGEIGATLALQAMSALFQEQAQPTINNPQHALDDMVFAAHHALQRYRAEQRLAESPRTTIVVALIQDHHAYWAHCGDSRLYWLRNGQILARTRDHSHVERLIKEGRLNPAVR